MTAAVHELTQSKSRSRLNLYSNHLLSWYSNLPYSNHLLVHPPSVSKYGCRTRMPHLDVADCMSSLTYDLIETALTLPKGYIAVFVKEEISEPYLHMGQMIVGESS